MSKLKAQWDRDHAGNCILVVEKSRGKITVDELNHFLLYEFRQYGHYAIHINASECCCGGSGWDFEEPKGDTVVLLKVDDDEVCPFCQKLRPPDYCPNCGESLKCASCGATINIGQEGD